MHSSWTTTPAYVADRNHDLVAVNELGRQFLPEYLLAGHNILESIVDGAGAETESRRRALWNQTITELTAALRFHGAAADPRLQLLVASLSCRSRVFRTAWASEEALPLRRGIVPVDIPPFGYIDFHWETVQVRGGAHFLTSFFGGPDSTAQAAVEFLAAKLRLEERLLEG